MGERSVASLDAITAAVRATPLVPGESLLRITDVMKRTSLSRSSIYRYIADERIGFPCPVQLGPGAVRWKSSEVDEWMANLSRTNDSQNG